MTIIFLGWVTGSQIIPLYRTATGRKSTGFGFEGNKITFCLGSFVFEMSLLPLDSLFLGREHQHYVELSDTMLENCLVLCVGRTPPTHTHWNRVWEPGQSYMTITAVHNAIIVVYERTYCKW